MIKKSFRKGFLAGGIIGVIFSVFAYFQIFVQPDITFDQIEVYNMEGNKTDLNAYKGKPLVVNIWATWCAPCLKEFPHFEEIKQELQGEVNFVMISDETPEKITNFVNTQPYTFNFLRSDKSFKEYGIGSRPTTYFFNADGQLITKHTGTMDIKTIKDLIETIQ